MLKRGPPHEPPPTLAPPRGLHLFIVKLRFLSSRPGPRRRSPRRGWPCPARPGISCAGRTWRSSPTFGSPTLGFPDFCPCIGPGEKLFALQLRGGLEGGAVAPAGEVPEHFPPGSREQSQSHGAEDSGQQMPPPGSPNVAENSLEPDKGDQRAGSGIGQAFPPGPVSGGGAYLSPELCGAGRYGDP